MKDRIKTLLINGHKAGDVASILGISPSYISQLLSDPDFKKEVETDLLERIGTDTDEEEKDKRYDRLEHRIITEISTSLGEASFGEKLRALEVINKRSDSILASKRPVLQGQLPGTIQIVQIGLPLHVAKNLSTDIVLNSQSEIIAIEGKPLAPMSSNGVKNIFAEIATRIDAQRVEEEQKILAEL